MSVDGCPSERRSQIDRVMHSLGNSVRRTVIYFFEHVNPGATASLDELTAYVDDRLSDGDPASIRLELWHNHLPTLAERGWLDVDRRTERIHYHGHETAEQLLLEVVDIFME